MPPRQRFTSVPWAMRATVAATALSGGDGDDDDWTINGTNMDARSTESKGLAVVSRALDGFDVQEMFAGMGTCELD